MITPVAFVREPLQMLKVDAIGYGAKDTGEMGGGAAAAILTAAGPEILKDLQAGLAKTSRRVGDVVLTVSCGLQKSRIRWIVHIVSIIKHTPQGAYCPQPEKLRDGVTAALLAATKVGARSMAFSALGTGEGRVDPSAAARYMLEGVKEFRRRPEASDITITFSLPSFRDYEAFRAVQDNHP